MSAHVVLVDSSARRAVVKTTPGTYLSDVLQEGATKLGYKPEQFGLKHNNKPIDLSRTIRLSGLASGAKLELVQASRSTGVVSVALQLPESEAQGLANPRITDKFPSNTTLWLVLRKFESGVAGSMTQRNLTARGVPATNAGDSGAGRLYYEQPHLNIMGRELSTFTDLQKTLAQLGFNSGSCLIRLNYKTSDSPLEDAMAQIQQYFDSTDPQPTSSEPIQPARSTEHISKGKEKEITEEAQPDQPKPEWAEDEGTRAPPATNTVTPMPDSSTSTTQPSTAPTGTLGNRPISVYRPPTTTTPTSVTTTHNESDYTPTIEHAQAHQAHLQKESRNKRLLTDAQLEAQAKETREKLESITDVEIKIRFPDQSAVSARFGQQDTASRLYAFVTECLTEQVKGEAFVLRNPGVRGKGEVVVDDARKLIVELGLKGRVLVVFEWKEGVAAEVKSVKNVLKEELREQAREFVAPDVTATNVEEDAGVKINLGPKEPTKEGEDGKKKMPKWLSGLKKK